MKKMIYGVAIIFIVTFFIACIDVFIVRADYVNINSSADINDTAISFWTSADINKNWGAHARTYTSGIGCFAGSGGYYSNTLIKFNITKFIIANSIVTGANISMEHAPPCGGSAGNSRIIQIYFLKVGWIEGAGNSDAGEVYNSSWVGNDTGRWLGGNFGPLNYNITEIANATIVCGTRGRYNFTFNSVGLNYLNNVLNGTYPNHGFLLNLSTAMTGADAYSFTMKENGTYAFMPRMEISYTPANITPVNETPANITLNSEKKFCYNSDYLYKKTKDIADNGSAVFNEYLEYCPYGCSNATLTTLGKPGCKASDQEQLLILVVICVAVIISLRWVIK